MLIRQHNLEASGVELRAIAISRVSPIVHRGPHSALSGYTLGKARAPATMISRAGDLIHPVLDKSIHKSADALQLAIHLSPRHKVHNILDR